MTYTDTDYLESQLEQYQDAERQREDDERQRQEQKQHDRQEIAYQMNRSAETWPEALQKQAALMGSSASELDDPDGVYGKPGTYFGDGRDACTRAIELWKEIKASKREKLNELRQQIDTIQDEIREEVSEKLKVENDSLAWVGIANSIEEDVDFYHFLNW